MMEELIRARLLAAPAVAALCGLRVNWAEHPQGAGWPGVILYRVSGAEGATLKGPDGLEIARLQADCVALTYAQAVALSRAVVAALNGWREGEMRAVIHAATRDGREGGSNEAERPFRISLDFTTHRRVSP